MRRLRSLLSGALLACVAAAVGAAPLPKFVSRDGRHVFTVDGAPFLILGGQANNSSNYPAMLPKVWPAIRQLHANTLEIPVAWEQIEPVEGKFDFSWVDALIPQARANGIRLDLLWFGTWKNTGPSYTPEWVKGDPKRFPRMVTKDHKTHYVLTPLSRTTLEADKRAFVALMRHIREIDPDHTVVLVQVENEVGSYGSARDYSPQANRLFAGPIPAELARKVGKSGTWSQVFDWNADTAFAAWHMGRYIDEIAAAGQAELNLPMYVNVVVGNPFDAKAGGGASGGADWPVLDIWKAAAPHIAIAAPDLYDRDYKVVNGKLDRMSRPDNPLFVPENGNDLAFARFFWLALGKGAIGWAPFGMDATGYFNYPLGAKALDPQTFEAFASKFALVAPIAKDWARLAFEHPTAGFAKGDDASDQSATLGRWKVTAQYGLWPFGEPSWTWMKVPPNPDKERPVGGAAVIQLGPDEFLLAGSDVRMRFGLAQPAPGENSQFLDVQEGTFENGRWVMSRRWNGDQTDYGLNLSAPTLLKVRLGTYR